LQPVKTPADLTLINPGKHYVEVKKEGYDTFKQDVTMPEGGTITVDAVFKAGGDESATFTTEEAPAEGIVTIGDATGVKSDPDRSANLIIWSQKDGDKSVVYVYDSKKGKADILFADTKNQEEPSLSEDYIVWSTGGDGSDIILRNLVSGTDTYITEDPLKQKSPYTDGKYVIYIEEDESRSKYDVVLYTIATGDRMVIATGKSEKSNPVIWGDYIVYEDMRTGKPDLYLYQISTGTEKVVSIPGEKANPDIFEDKIVYEDYRDGNSDIYLFNITSGTEQVIASGPGDQVRPSISGNITVFEDLNGDQPVVMVYYSDSGKIATLGSVTGMAYPRVRDGVIVYLDKNGTVLNKMPVP